MAGFAILITGHTPYRLDCNAIGGVPVRHSQKNVGRASGWQKGTESLSMRDKEKDAAQMAARRQGMLEVAFALFAERGIEAVSMPQVAKACGCGIATLYRYFNTKFALAVAVSTWAWERCFAEDNAKYRDDALGQMTGAQQFEAYLDRFLDLYRNHRNLLRFNQLFNIYVQAEDTSPDQMAPYLRMIREVRDWFHGVYSKGQQDGTMRTDVTEDELFATTIHLMLAATTRYAVGLVFEPQDTPGVESELILLKNMLMREYVTSPEVGL